MIGMLRVHLTFRETHADVDHYYQFVCLGNVASLTSQVHQYSTCPSGDKPSLTRVSTRRLGEVEIQAFRREIEGQHVAHLAEGHNQQE